MTSQPDPKPRFADMSARQKVVFVLKIALCLISFGFIYPHILE